MRRLSFTGSFIRACSVLSLTGISALAAGPPTAGDVRAAADAFDRGRQAFREESFVEAADNFENADARAPNAAALKLAIRARDLAGQLDRAATLAELGSERHPDDSELVEVALDVLRRARPELYEVRASCDEPCELLLDGKIVHGAAARARTLFVLPVERHTLRATWSKRRASSRELVGEAGETGEVSFVAPARESEPPSEGSVAPVSPQAPAFDEGYEDRKDTGRSGISPAFFWVGLGLTSVLGGVTAWSGIDTQQNPGADRVREACRSGSADCETLYRDGVARQDRTNMLLAVTGGVGLVTLIVGAGLTDWGGTEHTELARRADRRSAFSLRPWVALGCGSTESGESAGVAHLGARGRF